MNVVLFLGAGFSRLYGLPVMRDFFDVVDGAAYLEQVEKDFIFGLREEAQKAEDMYHTDRANFEDILSFCFIEENFGVRYPHETSERYHRLCRILEKVYRRVSYSNSDAYWRLPLTNLKRLLNKEVLQSHTVTIITTNYDVVLEYNLSRLGLFCRLPCAWKPVEPEKEHMPMYRDTASGLLVCKLHGSLNWFSAPEDKLVVENRIVRKSVARYDGTDHRWEDASWPWIAGQDYVSDDLPLIIPPVDFKLWPNPCFQAIWDAARDALKQVHKLVFIGYSFPKSDTYLRRFLGKSMSGNPRLKSITVIDPKAKTICDDLKQSGFGHHFAQSLKAYGGKWETITSFGIFN